MIALVRGRRLRTPLSGAAEAILRTEGVLGVEADGDVGKTTAPIWCLQSSHLSEDQVGQIVTFVSGGGSLIAWRPPRSLLLALGLRPTGRVLGCGYLSFPDHPLIPPTLAGHTLQVPSPYDLMEPGGNEVLGWWRDPLEGDRVYPAILSGSKGDGRFILFTYDPIEAVVKLRQGQPWQASDQWEGDPDGTGFVKPNDLFVGLLDFRFRLTPQADLHQRLISHFLDHLAAERGLPFLRVWTFPNAFPSLGLLTGDSDSMKREHLDQVLSIVEDYGARYTIYLMEDDWELVSRNEANEMIRKGHGVAHHTWVGPYPSLEEMREGVRRQIDGFRQRFGFQPLSHRGHCCIWVGWVDQAKILAENGIRLDGNHYSYVHHQYGFLSGSGKPFRFCDHDGSSVDLWEQPTLMSDDCMLQDKTHIPPFTVDGAIEKSRELIDALTDRWGGVFHVCFHPVYMRKDWNYAYTAPWIEAVAEYLQSRGIPTVSAEAWADFVTKRETVRLTKMRTQNRQAVLELTCHGNLSGVTFILPERTERAEWEGQPAPVLEKRLEGITKKVLIGNLTEERPTVLTLPL